MYDRKGSQASLESVKSWSDYASGFSPYKNRYISSSDYVGDDDDDDDDNVRAVDYAGLFDFYDIDVESSKGAENAMDQVILNEAYCFDIYSFSEKFIDALIIEAKREISRKLRTNYACPLLQKGKLSCSLGSLFGSSVSDDEFCVSWPKISEFNIKLGQEKLETYLSKWQRSEEWLFCVEFLGFESEDCSNIFVYEAEWSKPTMSYPIPQATASVFFAMEVFKMVPHNRDRSVEVSYVFECSNVIHKAGKIHFQEKWLQDILDAKLAFFKTITFGGCLIFFTRLWGTIVTGRGLASLSNEVKKHQVFLVHRDVEDNGKPPYQHFPCESFKMEQLLHLGGRRTNDVIRNLYT